MDRFPKCQICQQQFTLKGSAPYLLPCLHAVCETCVTSTAGGVISCSTCQREVNLTETHLHRDVVRQREIFHLTVKHRPSELLCTHEDDGNQAVCWCQECEKLFCEYCQNMHNSFAATRNHAVEKVGHIKPDLENKEEYCNLHKKYILEYWDKHCEILICYKCRHHEHSAHDVDDIDVAAESIKSATEELLNMVESVKGDHKAQIDTIRKQVRDTDQTSNMLIKKAGHIVHSLKGGLDQVEKEMAVGVERQSLKIKSHLESMLKTAVDDNLACNLTTEYISKALLYSSRQQLLKMKKAIREQTQLCIVSTGSAEKNILPMLDMERLDDMKSRISSFGDLVDREQVKSSPKNDEQVSQDVLEQLDKQGLFKMDRDRKIESQAYFRCTFWPAALTVGVVCIVVAVLFQAMIIKIERLEMDNRTATLEMKNVKALLKTVTTAKQQAEEETNDNKNKWKKEETVKEQLILTWKQRSMELEEQNKKNVANIREAEANYERLLSNLGIPTGVTPHLLKTETTIIPLYCVHIKYDNERVNLEKAHITSEGHLVNQRGERAGEKNDDRFVKYCGTCSTDALPLFESSIYWEVRAHVNIENTLPASAMILEIGLCGEQYRDIHKYLPWSESTYRIKVKRHFRSDSVTVHVLQNGPVDSTRQTTLRNKAGSHVTLHFGVVFDDSRSKVAFMDVATFEVMSVVNNIDSSKPLWPMFGVYNGHLVKVDMELVVGQDIEMTDEKKEMILKALL